MDGGVHFGPQSFPSVGHSVRGGPGWWSGRRGTARLRTRPSYTRLPGQETTVSATRLRCSFSMGTSAEWLMPAVDRPLTATIMSPHLETRQTHVTCTAQRWAARCDLATHLRRPS